MALLQTNFKGDYTDLKAFEKLVYSPIRSTEREKALAEWAAYKLGKQIKLLKKKDKSERILTKGGYVEALTLNAIDLRGVNLDGITLGYADMRGVLLDGASLRGAWMKGTNFQRASLQNVDFSPLGERNTRLFYSDLSGADLSNSNLNSADLSDTNLKFTNLKHTELQHSILQNSVMVETNLENADLTGAFIYGVSAWNIKVLNAVQRDLIITSGETFRITVDDIEIAQFIYLLLNNDKIRNVIDTVGKKGVLILGRFTKERKVVLDALRVALRERNFIPMLFDFDKPKQRDFTETIMTLAGLSRFVIADITNPKSSPLELQALVPDYQIPFITIIQENEKPFSMFSDLQNKYDWVAKPLEYGSVSDLVEVLDEAIIEEAERILKLITVKKSKSANARRNVRDFRKP